MLFINLLNLKDMSEFSYQKEHLLEIDEIEPLPEELDIKIERMRTFFEFESPSVMKVTEEITLFNKGRSTPYFPYKIDKFRPSLQITDSNGENLLFHSFERYKQYKKYNNIISIRFPKNNPLERNEHRLIKMQYINCLRQTNLKEANLTVGVFKNASIYSFIKSVKDMNSLLITNLSKFILMIELQIFKQKGIQLIMKSSAIQKKL